MADFRNLWKLKKVLTLGVDGVVHEGRIERLFWYSFVTTSGDRIPIRQNGYPRTIMHHGRLIEVKDHETAITYGQRSGSIYNDPDRPFI
ncbi:MAG TPA: hypothetical protein VJH04_01710 [archaeon]|nr:hypothetical protein [archaeon]